MTLNARRLRVPSFVRLQSCKCLRFEKRGSLLLEAPRIFKTPGAEPRRKREHFRSEEHTSELQSHRDLHSFPTRRSSDLSCKCLRFEKRGSLLLEAPRIFKTPGAEPRRKREHF